MELFRACQVSSEGQHASPGKQRQSSLEELCTVPVLVQQLQKKRREKSSLGIKKARHPIDSCEFAMLIFDLFVRKRF